MVYFWGAVLLIVAILGIIDIVNSAKYSIKAEGRNARVYYFVESFGTDESLEFVVRETIKKYQWNSAVKSLHIVIVDCGMDAQTEQICGMIVDEYDFVSVIKKDSFPGQLSAFK